jgi:hypothetical protein
MRGWEIAEGITNRWTGGMLVASKLSADEAVVFDKLGTPDAIRFFRENQSRQRVYEWVYVETADNVWFVDGTRVDYVAVDTKNSTLTSEQRETLRDKLVTGGVLGATVGVIAAGAIIFGERVGLGKN